MNSVKNSPTLEFEKNSDVGLKIAKVIAFVLVLIGMLNTIPAIPGLEQLIWDITGNNKICLLYTSPSPRDGLLSRMPSSA